MDAMWEFSFQIHHDAHQKVFMNVLMVDVIRVLLSLERTQGKQFRVQGHKED